jgi:hypothetical protein
MTNTKKLLNLNYYTNNNIINDKLKDNKNTKLKNNLNYINVHIFKNNLKKDSIDLNKVYIDLNKYKKKSSYFESFFNAKQNRQFIRLPFLSDKLEKSRIFKYLKTKKKDQLFFTKVNTKIRFIYLFSKILINFINVLILDMKLNGFNSQILKKTQKSELQKNNEKNFSVIKINQEKKLNYTNYTVIDNNSNILTLPLPFKLIFIKKKFFFVKQPNNNLEENNNPSSISCIENKFNYIDKENYKYKETIGKINENINKGKYDILNFFSKYKNKKKSQQNLVDTKFCLIKKIYHKKIRIYIKSNIVFNSKIAKFLATSNNYSFYKYNKLNYSVRNNIYEFLHESFISMFSLISKPVFIIKSDQISIQLFYFLLRNIKINKKYKSFFILKNKNKLNIICNILTRFFKKPVKLVLIRLYYPYFNSNILVKLFSIFINKIRLRKIVSKFIGKAIQNKFTKNVAFNKKSVLSELTGINIKVAGRLLTQRVIPRKTVKIISSGLLARGKTMFVETSRFTNKNKRGAFSLTIKIGHKLVKRNFSTLN